MVILGGLNLSIIWVGTDGTNEPDSDKAARSTNFEFMSIIELFWSFCAQEAYQEFLLVFIYNLSFLYNIFSLFQFYFKFPE